MSLFEINEAKFLKEEIKQRLSLLQGDELKVAKRLSEETGGLVFPDCECIIEVPIGTLLRSIATGQHFTVKESFNVKLDERGDTNSDNIRVATTLDGRNKFHIQGKIWTNGIFSDEDLSEYIEN